MEKELINSEEANAKTTENIKKLNDFKFLTYQSTLSNIKEEIKKEITQAIEQCEYSCIFYTGLDRIEYNSTMYYDWDEKDINNLIKEVKEFIEQFNYKCKVSKSKFIGRLIDIEIDWSK